MVKKLHWKKKVANFLAMTLAVGSLLQPAELMFVNAMESVEKIAETKTKQISEDKKDAFNQIGNIDKENWYVYGRPMTEEEKVEQLRLTEYYNSMQSGFEAEEFVTMEAENPEILPEETEDTDLETFGMDGIQNVPVSYSSREMGYTPRVRNQGDLGICWAMTAISCLEINMIKNGIASQEIDLSENHLVYYIYRPVEDPLGGTIGEYDHVSVSGGTVREFFSGLSIGSTPGVMLSGMGPVSEENFYTYEYLAANHMYPADHNNTSAPYGSMNDPVKAYGNKEAYLTDYFTISMLKPTEIKKAIMEYGAVGVHYNSGSESFNPDFAAQYSPVSKSENHAVTIVGWNDEYPKENFLEEPLNDGAWLVRNSWGSSWGDSGYFWLSYEDATIGGGVYVFKTASADKYDSIYQYDRASNSPGYVNGAEKGKIESVNIFEIKKEKEILKAVQFVLMWHNINYEIQIYKNPVEESEPSSGTKLLDKPIVGSRMYGGVYTVELDTPIELQKGDKIAVSVTFFSDRDNVQPAAPRENNGISINGQSLYRIYDGAWGEWKDCGTQGNFCIRAYTGEVEENIGESHIHKWKEDFNFNDNYHWKECDGDGVCSGEAEERNYGEHIGGTAKCNARAVCSICEKPYGTTNSKEHGGSMVRKYVVQPTKTQTGYTGDLCCSGCDYIYEEGEEIPKLQDGGSNPFLPEGVANLNYTFTGVDESQVSSLAVDKPKLLIFYGAKCGHCINTLNSLTKKTLEGVDICAVEVKSNTKNDVTNLMGTLGAGKDNITFCYDEGYEAMAAKVEYEKAYNGLTYSALPVLCYIDSENQIRYMTSGQQTYDEIKGNLAVYCNMKTTNLNLPNPSDKSFDSLEGTPLSMTAEGKPKVLIFFDSLQNSKETLQSISSEKIPGADIYGYDVLTQNVDKVTEFVDIYVKESSGIKVSADSMSMFEMFEYTGAAGETNITYPVICYIDAENKFQHITMGVSNLLAVKTNLMANCGYVPAQEEEPVEPPKEEITDFTIVNPSKTTYLEGEELDVTGGKLVLSNQSEVSLSEEMVSGYESGREGEQILTVTYENITKNFKVLVVSKPTGLKGMQEEKLSSVLLEESGYGSFRWKEDTVLSQPGVSSYQAIFTPTDGTYTVREDVWIEVTVEEKPVTPPEEGEEPTPPEGDEEPIPPSMDQIILSEIMPVVYTGKAIKPQIQVYDGKKLLQAGKDYKITYKNNINAGSVEVTEEFKENLPYVIIEGKGNYTGILKRNFTILPNTLSDNQGNPAEGLKVNYTEQLLVNTKKAQSPFKNISFGKKLKAGTDYLITLTAESAKTATGETLNGVMAEHKVPQGAKGSFKLTIIGKGNYTGEVNLKVEAGEKNVLMKYAKITLDKAYKFVDFLTFKEEYGGKLPKEAYEVKLNGETLTEKQDYEVSFIHVDNIGTATLVVEGKGQYQGRKTMKFKLAGRKFRAATVEIEGVEDKVYTGKEEKQYDITVSCLQEDGKKRELVSGTDYVISYHKNLNKGTAVMVITATPSSGYQGSVKKNYKILAEDLKNLYLDSSAENIIAEYDKSGVKPAEQVRLSNRAGVFLVEGKDYTLTYRNNKAIAEKEGTMAPVMVVKGKGNFFGTLEIPFTITKASLDSAKISIAVKQMAYNVKKAKDYQYTPAVTVKDGKKKLSTTDYHVRYVNCTQAEWEAYYLEQKEDAPMPRIEITAREGSNYGTESPVILQLPVYQTKFTAKNLHTVISDITYTGQQCIPQVTVYYSKENVAKKAKGITSEEELLKLGFVKLEETEYSLEYGSNIFGGKNKGTVKVTGNGGLYGGSVNFKFSIAPKELGQ